MPQHVSFHAPALVLCIGHAHRPDWPALGTSTSRGKRPTWRIVVGSPTLWPAPSQAYRCTRLRRSPARGRRIERGVAAAHSPPPKFSHDAQVNKRHSVTPALADPCPAQLRSAAGWRTSPAPPPPPSAPPRRSTSAAEIAGPRGGGRDAAGLCLQRVRGWSPQGRVARNPRVPTPFWRAERVRSRCRAKHQLTPSRGPASDVARVAAAENRRAPNPRLPSRHANTMSRTVPSKQHVASEGHHHNRTR